MISLKIFKRFAGENTSKFLLVVLVLLFVIVLYCNLFEDEGDVYDIVLEKLLKIEL